MERFIQLHLQSDSEKAEPANLPNPERNLPEPSMPSKRLKRIGDRAAHKAASEFSRNKSGIFSK
jgi:hypothetical protein